MSRPAAPASLSLGEVEAIARKAARGAGYAWGMAEVAGQATRGLATLGLDGCAALLSVLDTVAGASPDCYAPQRLDGNWTGAAGRLCPLTTGASLTDMARNLPRRGIELSNVMMPVLLLPAVADVARALGEPVTLSWLGGIISAGDDGLPEAAATAKLSKRPLADLHIHPGGIAQPAAKPRTRATPDPNVWAALNRYAARTYAPATEASRLAGAGAGLTDND